MNQKNKSKNKAKAGSRTAKKQQQKKQNPRPRGASNFQGTSTFSSDPLTGVSVAYSSQQRGRQPNIRMNAKSCRVIHKELVSSVVGTSAFSILASNSLSVNPGLPASFPWLSSIASSWERYRFHKLRFCYYTRCASSTAGSMMIAPDYDAGDVAPATEQIMSSYSDVVEDAPWKNIVCELRPQSMFGMAKELYVRNGPLAANLDIKTYDAATVFLATTDGGATNWGKVFVEYDVEFFIPQLPSQGIVFGGAVNGANTITAANPFGILPVVDAQANGISMDAASTLTIANAGTYLIAIKYVGTVITVIPVPVGTNASVTNVTSVFDAAALNGVTIFHSIASAGGTLNFPAITATTITSAYLRIAQAPVSSLA